MQTFEPCTNSLNSEYLRDAIGHQFRDWHWASSEFRQIRGAQQRRLECKPFTQLDLNRGAK